MVRMLADMPQDLILRAPSWSKFLFLCHDVSINIMLNKLKKKHTQVTQAVLWFFFVGHSQVHVHCIINQRFQGRVTMISPLFRHNFLFSSMTVFLDSGQEHRPMKFERQGQSTDALDLNSAYYMRYHRTFLGKVLKVTSSSIDSISKYQWHVGNFEGFQTVRWR